MIYRAFPLLVLGSLCTCVAFGQDSTDNSTAPASEPTQPAEAVPQFKGIDREGRPIFEVDDSPKSTTNIHPEDLVEDFTALTLHSGEYKLGTELEYGVTDRAMIGIDLLSTLVGAPTLQMKYFAYERGAHKFGLGMRAAYINKSTVLWGSARDHFDELEAQYFRPALSWSNQFSPRLRIHTYLAQGFGSFHAKLSAEGRRKLWEAKHPGGDYSTRTTETEGGVPAESSESNQEQRTSNKSDSFAQRSLQVSSVTGIMADTFQMTGEFLRKSGHKILITTRIERMELEKLKANSLRLTAAQQWVWQNFQIRLGIGVQYVVISGRDLDREYIDEAGILPASDIRFYWRF